MNTCRLVVALLACLGIAALAWPSVQTPTVRFVYNPSDSVPRGWYRIDPPDSLHVGSIVLTQLPADAAALAAQRGYLPDHIPLLKRIGAISPQQVCIEKHIVRIDGVAVTGVRATDGRGRPLLAWQQCRRLRDGELFLLSATSPASFDSRYFGPVAVTAVIGRAQPLWTWDTPNVQQSLPFFVQSHYTWFAPRPMASVLHPCRRSQPARRSRSRQRSEKTEGKIKGRGTSSRRKHCLHVGWRGTRFEWPSAVCGAKSPPALAHQRASPARLGSAALEFMP